MIDKLTREQESKIKIYFEKWKEIGFSSKRIDREKAKKLLKKYTALIGLKTKYFFFFDSPMACELAINFLKTLKILKLHTQLDTQLRTQLHTQLDTQLHTQLDTQLDTQLRTQLDTQLHTQLDTQLRTQLATQLRTQLYTQLDTQLRTQLYTQLDTQLDTQLHTQLATQLATQLRTQLRTQKLEYFSINYWSQSGNIISGYCAFYDFLISEVKKLEKKEEMKLWTFFKNVNSELHYMWIFKDVVFCSEKPLELHFNNSDQLHNTTGASVKYADGYSLYALNGVSCPAWVIETPAEQIDCKKILEEQNAEIRRELVRKVGVERMIQKLGAKEIDSRGDYKLIEIEIGNNRKGRALKMKNPSIDTWHVEKVPATIKTVQEAINFRASQVIENGENWQPEQLT
jgi:hypothetical protein